MGKAWGFASAILAVIPGQVLDFGEQPAARDGLAVDLHLAGLVVVDGVHFVALVSVGLITSGESTLDGGLI